MIKSKNKLSDYLLGRSNIKNTERILFSIKTLLLLPLIILVPKANRNLKNMFNCLDLRS